VSGADGAFRLLPIGAIIQNEDGSPSTLLIDWWKGTGIMAEIDDLKRKLAARKGKPGYKENAAEIEARIAELEKQRQ